MNRAEAKIALRDLVLYNFFESFLGEGCGEMYKRAVAEADAQYEAAMKAAGDG